MESRKGMSVALTLVISIVVLIVVSLAVISISTGNLAQTGQNTQETQSSAFCEIEGKSKCNSGQADDLGQVDLPDTCGVAHKYTCATGVIS